MKIISFLMVVSLMLHFNSKAYSQDLLVTKSNDSINCKIINISNSYQYSVLENNSAVSKSLPASEVKLIIIDYYTKKKETNTSKNVVNNKNYINENWLDSVRFSKGKYRISANLIYAFRYGSINSSNAIEKDLYGQLRHNAGLLLDAHINISKKNNAYLGVQLGRIQANASVENVMLSHPSGVNYFGTLEAQTNISVIGANLLAKINLKDKSKLLLLSVGLNYVSYYDDLRISNYNLITTSFTVATSIGIIYDYRFNRNFAIGGGVMLDGGVLTNLTVEEFGVKKDITLNINDGIGIGRISLLCGLKCYL